MELSRPAVVQRYGHLTLTLHFKGQIVEMPEWDARLTWNKRDVSR